MIQKPSKLYSLKKFFLIIALYVLAISTESCGGGGSGGEGDTRGGLYTISGTVTSGGSSMTGVTITLAGSPTKTTDSNGAYQLTDLGSGSYTITPSKEGFNFSPASLTVSITNSNVPEQNFTATAVTWAKIYGGSSADIAHFIQQSSDGGFIVVGETSSFGLNSDVWILKLDVNGNIAWQKTYDGDGVDIAHSMQQTLDGGFIVAGETSSSGQNTDVWILKLDVNGNIAWQKTYGGDGADIAHSIQQTTEGGFIVAGETSSFGAETDVWILKMDANGNIAWEKRYGGSGEDIAHSIQQTSDGGYIIAGESNSFGGGDKDIWVLRLTSAGAIQWQKTYGTNTSEDSAYSVQQTSDGGFIVAGETIAGRPDVWVLKLDANGAIQWQKTYGGANDDAAKSIQQTSDGGYILAGVTSSFAHFFGDMWLIKLDASGTIQWEKTYGGNVSNSADSIRQTYDGGYIVAGTTTSFPGNSNYWVLKLDGTGDVGTGCAVIGTSNATVASTEAQAVDSLGTQNTTNAIIAITNITPKETNATPLNQCSSP